MTTSGARPKPCVKDSASLSGIGELDLRGLHAYVDRDDELWPTLAFADIEGTAVEFTPGVSTGEASRELAAQGAEHLAAVALAFAKEIREYRG